MGEPDCFGYELPNEVYMGAWMALLIGCGGKTTIVEDPSRDPGTPPASTPVPTPIPTPKPDCIEGDYLHDDALDIEVADCKTAEALHSFAGASGSTVAITVSNASADVGLRIETVYGDLITEVVVVDGGSIAAELPWTGEFLLRVTTEPGDLTLTRSCSLNCDRPYTRYPLFFMHGMAGTDSFLSVLDYWFEITDTLDDDGLEVATDAVDPFQVSEIRAEQWADHLDDFLNDGRHRRVNLIGHSQGGVDARFVATHLDPDHRIASVLTIGTPHHGVGMMDTLDGLLSFGLTAAAIDAAFDALVPLWGLDTDQDIVGQIQGFSPEVMRQFNLDTPDRADVYYASWGGRSCQALDLLCQLGNHGEIVTGFLAATHLVMNIVEGPNDGLVSVESARWGIDYGVISGDHLDEVGLLGGPLTSRGFDPVPFYQAEARRLRDLEF